MTTAEFWDQQQFSYIVTYSFNRGPKLLALHADTVAAIEQTKQELQQAPFRDQRKLAYQLRILKASITGDYQKTLTNEQLMFDVTAELIATIQTSTSNAAALADLLCAPVVNQYDWMCAPIYRDALAFYNTQDELISVLNICFECDTMLTDTGKEVQADESTYQALRQLLAQLGHPIETAGEQA